MRRTETHLMVFAASLFCLATSSANAQSGDADLAQELTNPIANLITVPIQMNFDSDIGPMDTGDKFTTNIQPVIPFSISDDWNLITRTIFPVISQSDVLQNSGSQFGLGDVNMSLFFSPKRIGASGITWGVGPVFVLPTATDSLLGTKKWSAGPGVVALTIRGPWTFGVLANHVWSFAGDNDRQDISNTFMQPFAAYTTPDAWTFALLGEPSYNWKSEAWSVPLNFGVSKLIRIGKLPVSLQAGIGYWLDSPASGAEGIRYRLQANIVLPKL